jgi:hypothetical protein
VKPFLHHRISSTSLNASNPLPSLSDRPVTNNDQSPGSDDVWIALSDEEELLPGDWAEAESAINPPDAQGSSDPDLPEIFAEEHADNMLHLPIARRPFPTPVRDISPIMGVSASNFL